MSKINSRNKGANGEREFSDLIFDLLGVRLIRNLEQSRSGGCDLIVSDIQNAEDQIIEKLNTLSIECKRYKAASNRDLNIWWEQACKQAELVKKLPCLAYRLDRKDWIVMVPLSFMDKNFTESWSFDYAVFMTVDCFCSVIRG